VRCVASVTMAGGRTASTFVTTFAHPYASIRGSGVHLNHFVVSIFRARRPSWPMGPFLAVNARGFDWCIASDPRLRLTRVIVVPLQALLNRGIPDTEVDQHTRDVMINGRGNTGGVCQAEA